MYWLLGPVTSSLRAMRGHALLASFVAVLSLSVAESCSPSLPDGLHPNMNALNVCWQPNACTLKIVSSIQFGGDDDAESFYWTPPASICKLVIAQNTKLTGGLRLDAANKIEVKGEDRDSSIIYGTEIMGWNKKKLEPPKPNMGPYSAISVLNATGSCDVHVHHLTVLNSRAFAMTALKCPWLVEEVTIRNTRGKDYHSNSDGISSGAGTVVRNCIIDTWDDSLKLYADMTVQNVTIYHNANGAPLQLGWGDMKPSTHHLSDIQIIRGNTAGQFNMAMISEAGGSLSNTTLNIQRLTASYQSTDQLRNGGNPVKLPWFACGGAAGSKASFNFKD